MPVPKRKRSRARRDSRFANKGMKAAAVNACPNCQSPNASHQICKVCGHYKGVKVLTTKLDRKLKRGEALKAQQQRQQKSNTPEQSE